MSLVNQLPTAWETPNNILSDATDEITLLPNGTPQINFKYCLRQVDDIVRACALEEQLKVYARGPLTEPLLRLGATRMAEIQDLPEDWATQNECGIVVEGTTREYMYGGAEVDEHFDYWQIDALVADNNRYMAIRMESQEEFHIYQFPDHTDFWLCVEEPCFGFKYPSELLSEEYYSFHDDMQVIKWQLAVGNIWLYGAGDFLTPEDADKLYWYVKNGNAGIKPEFFNQPNQLSLERE
tara:strand:+ start:1330 stop:2043 length:714 start_codon:yes stop_codon:yes gene_type:complete